MLDHDLVVTIQNFEKYNPRSDVKVSSWFRLEHSIFSDPKIYSLAPDEFRTWIYLLCEASKSNPRGTVHVQYRHADRTADIPKNVLHRTIKKLSSLHMVTVRTLRGRYGRVTSTNVNVSYETIRDETIRTNEQKTQIAVRPLSRPPDVDSFDLESIYKTFPVKKGKSKGMQRLAREIKTAEDFEALKVAVSRYMQTEEVKRGFVKHWSTFANEWRDWTDPDAGSVSVQQEPIGTDWEFLRAKFGGQAK